LHELRWADDIGGLGILTNRAVALLYSMIGADQSVGTDLTQAVPLTVAAEDRDTL